MNCFAAWRTRIDRMALVWMSSRSRTYNRPSGPLAFDLTSGSMSSGRNSARSDRSMGMSTSENAVTVCGTPSSSTWKSPWRRSRTKFPWASRTTASTST